LCSANGISAICSIPTKNITTRLVRTYRCTRTRRSRVPSRLSVARWRCQFWADCTTNISERKFPTGTPARIYHWTRMRLCGGRSSDAEPLSPRPFCPACIISIRGYDFREGHRGVRAVTPRQEAYRDAICTSQAHPAARPPAFARATRWSIRVHAGRDRAEPPQACKVGRSAPADRANQVCGVSSRSPC
jgi:hypothetical protein